jgi:hypothetical protein
MVKLDKVIGFTCIMTEEEPYCCILYKNGRITKVNLEKIKEAIRQIEEYLESRCR